MFVWVDIHQSKLNNGTTKVRIISKEGRNAVKVNRIGTAHNETN
jgi:hypothetical protein